MIKMGHVLEASVAHHYQKIWEVTPLPPLHLPQRGECKDELMLYHSPTPTPAS